MAACQWKDLRASNMLDGGAHFYGTYRCADDKWVAIGSIEPQFYALLVEKSGIGQIDMASQRDPLTWSDMRKRFEHIFEQRTRAQWCEIMEGTDVCFAPVMGMAEAANHPHNQARKTFCEIDGVLQPSPAPRFSVTESEVAHGPVPIGSDTTKVLSQLGFSDEQIRAMSGA